MDKFNRAYELTIQTGDLKQFVTIQLPFTIEFNIHRRYGSSQNDANIRIYNLSPQTRDLIRVDFSDLTKKREVILKAGYGNEKPVIFAGYVNLAQSVRDGVNFVTTIEAMSGNFAYTQATTGFSFGETTNNKVIVEQLINAMGGYGVKKGVISPKINTQITRATACDRNPIEELKDRVGTNGFFIDNNTINVIGENECIAGTANLINASTGLLATPVIYDQYVRCNVLFEPRFLIGQKVFLETETGSQKRLGYETAPNNYQYSMNGFYKIYEIIHNGTISDALGGNAVTTLGLQAGTFGELV